MTRVSSRANIEWNFSFHFRCSRAFVVGFRPGFYFKIRFHIEKANFILNVGIFTESKKTCRLLLFLIKIVDLIFLKSFILFLTEYFLLLSLNLFKSLFNSFIFFFKLIVILIVKFKKKFNFFSFFYLFFRFISFPICNRLFFLFSKFSLLKKIVFAMRKKKKIVFMPENVRATLKLLYDVFIKFYKLSDSMTIPGITYVGILEETEYRIRTSN